MAQQEFVLTKSQAKEVMKQSYELRRQRLIDKYKHYFEADEALALALEDERTNANKQHQYLMRHGEKSMTLVIADGFEWVVNPITGRKEFKNIHGLAPYVNQRNWTSVDSVNKTTGEMNYSHKYFYNGKWTLKKAKYLTSPIQYAWLTIIPFMHTLKHIEIHFTKEQLEAVKSNWFDKYVYDRKTKKPLKDEKGKPVVQVYGYRRYATLFYWAKTNNIELQVHVKGAKHYVSSIGKISFKEMVEFEYNKEEYSHNDAWYELARAGYTVIYKPFSSDDLSNAIHSLYGKPFYDKVFFEVDNELYDYGFLTESYTVLNSEGDEIYKTVWDVSSHLDDNYYLRTNIGLFGEYIGAVDRKYNAQFRGHIKQLVTKGEFAPISPSFKLDDEADALIKEYLDIEFHDAPDLNVAYNTILNHRFTPENPTKPVETDMDGKIQLPKLVKVEYIKEKSSEGWNDDDAISLGIQWAKRYKTRNEYGLVESFGDQDYLDSMQPADMLSSLPTTQQVDDKLDREIYNPRIEEAIRQYAEAKEYGYFAYKFNKLKKEIKQTRKTFAERRKEKVTR